MNKQYCVAALTLVCLNAHFIAAAPISKQSGGQTQTNSPELAEASRLSQQVVTLHNQGMYDEALPLAKRVLEIREKFLGSEHQLVGVALRNLAGVYFAKKQYGEAAKYYQRALKVYEKTLGDHDPKLADLLESLAWSNYGFGETATAEGDLQRALEIREKAFGADSKEVGESLYVLGLFYQKSGRADRAIKRYKRAIPIMEKTEGTNSKNLAAVLEKCACALMSVGQTQEAAGMQTRAREIMHPGVHIPGGKGSGGGGVLQGSAVFRAEPAYPPAAKYERISGTVIVEVTVDETGKVLEARSICGPDILAAAAVEAAKRWRFTPTLLSGHPVKVIGTITFNFHL